MWHGNLDAIVASHQDTILGSAQMGDAHRQPYADRQQGDRECEGGHVRQHPLPIVVGFLRHALVARQVAGDFKRMDEGRMMASLGEGRSRARPELEHAVLFLRRGRNDGSLGSHRCQLQDSFFSSSTPALLAEVKIKIVDGRSAYFVNSVVELTIVDPNPAIVEIVENIGIMLAEQDIGMIV
jgi:hypothetical protein